MWGPCVERIGSRGASSGLVKHDCSRGGILGTWDCGQGRNVLLGRGRTTETKNYRKNLGQIGEWETTPSDRRSGTQSQDNREEKWEA